MSAYDDLCVADGADVLWASFAGTTATDAAGHDNGTISGAPTLGQTLTGAPGLEANGVLLAAASSQYIHCAHDATFLPQNNGPFSMEMWLQIAANPGSTVWIYDNGNGLGPAIELATTGFLTLASSGTTNLYGANWPGSALALNRAHHIVATTASATLGTAKTISDTKVYVDGVDVTPGSITANTGFSNGTITFTDFAIGANANPASFCSGIIAKPAWYNVQLTAAQVLAHYWAGVLPAFVRPAFLPLMAPQGMG